MASKHTSEDGLNEAQRLFAHEYIIDFNATRAAKAAGYKETNAHIQGCSLLRNPKIKAKIEELKRKREKVAEVDAAYVLKRLVEIDQLDVKDICNDDLTFKPLTEWPDAWTRSLSGIDIKRIEAAEDITSVIHKIKWPDKLRNLELLGKHVEVKAFEEDANAHVTVQHIMPVPSADSVDDWEAASEQVHDKTMSHGNEQAAS